MHFARHGILEAFLAVAMFALMLQSTTSSYAMQLGKTEVEVEPYLKGGTIAWDSLSGIGGHKFLLAAGLNTNVAYRSVGTTINLEKWWVAEGLNDDKGLIPNQGYSVATDLKYFF